jgi:hypothetical protein
MAALAAWAASGGPRSASPSDYRAANGVPISVSITSPRARGRNEYSPVSKRTSDMSVLVIDRLCGALCHCDAIDGHRARGHPGCILGSLLNRVRSLRRLGRHESAHRQKCNDDSLSFTVLIPLT